MSTAVDVDELVQAVKAANMTDESEESKDPQQGQHRRWTLLEDSIVDYGYLNKTGGQRHQ